MACVAVAAAVAVSPAAGADTGAVGRGRPWLSRALSPDRRAALIERRLSVAEKLALVSGVAPCRLGADGYVPGVPRLGLPPLQLVGAGMGVTDLCHRKVRGPTTELPAPIALAATWDPAAAVSDGALIGRETRAVGYDYSIGGDVNIARDPRSGRTFEGEGEDPLLAGTIVGAQLRGTQAEHVPATIKHYAENNEERYRVGQSSNVSERVMREIELRAFQIGIAESGASAVMCAYNLVNGRPSCSNKHLLGGVLKHDWHFPGYVMTDWGACGSPRAPFGNPIPVCSTAGAAASGLDQQQPLPTFFAAPAVARALVARQLRRSRLDDMVKRILRGVFAVGLFDHPVRAHPIDAAAGAVVAGRVAQKAAVLLRNSNDLLPLDARTVRSIAVIGTVAAAPPPHASFISSADVLPICPDTALQAIRQRARGVRVRYADGTTVRAAVALARRSRVAVVFARDVEAERYNRPHLGLGRSIDALIGAVARANPQTIVVLETGGPVTMPWVGRVGAVLEAWYPGERGGHAVARLLFGDVSPSGRLPITFPRREADLPTFGSRLRWPGTPARIEYSEGLRVGYRWYDAKRIRPLFPFGFGLTYGAVFRYAGLAVAIPPRGVASSRRVVEDRRLTRVRFTVANRGTRAAIEVAQVYVGFPASVGEPPRRLAGWASVRVTPGRARTVSVDLPESAFDYWSTRLGRWRIAPGRYVVSVGSSSRDLRLRAAIRLR
jgi:beta-glucosidase